MKTIPKARIIPAPRPDRLRRRLPRAADFEEHAAGPAYVARAEKDVAATEPGRWAIGHQFGEPRGDRLLMHRDRHHAFEYEFLDALAVLHLGDIEIALGVDVHVVHDVKLSRRDTVSAE